VRLTVSYSDEGEVEIAMDRDGLDHLMRALVRLPANAPDHDHMMAEDWGGDELATDEPGLGNIAHHVRLQLVGSEAGRDRVGSTWLCR
jgi:hypothetical protein